MNSITDCFSKIVPLAVHQALMAFENRKAAIVNAEVGRLRENTQLLNGLVLLELFQLIMHAD